MEFRKYNTTRTGQHTYQNTYFDQCGNCLGSGLIRLIVPVASTLVVCPVCEGSGVVQVTKNIEVIVKPYKTLQK